MFLVSLVVLVALVTVMSGIGVCERCTVGNGGVYSMISMVLGGRIGGTVGLLYVFGQVRRSWCNAYEKKIAVFLIYGDHFLSVWLEPCTSLGLPSP